MLINVRVVYCVLMRASIFFLLCTPTLVFSNTKEIQQLAERKKCNYAVIANLNQFLWIQGHWFDPDRPQWHVGSNFNALQRHNSKQYEAIDKLLAAALDVPDSFDALQEKVRSLDLEQSSISRHLSDVSVKNYYFEILLYNVESALAELSEETAFLKSNCQSYGESLQRVIEILQVWQEDLNILRSYITQQQTRVDNLYLVALEVARSRMFSRYIEKTTDSLESVKTKLNETLVLDREYGDFMKWYQHLVAHGLVGDGLHTKYLQFTAPLRIMKSQLVKAQAFRQRIAALPSNSTQQRVLGEIDLAVELIAEQITNLERTGWRGQLAQQIRMSKARQERLTQPSKACLQALSGHLKLAEKVISENEFHQVELLYFNSVGKCTNTK